METSQNLKQEIMGLEKRYWQAMKDKDLKTALDMTDFPCIVASSHGAHTVDKEAFEKMFKTEDVLKDVQFDDSKVEVRQVSADTAVIAYEINSQFSKDGKDIKMNAIDTSTWVRKNNKWVCSMHTEIEKAPKN